MVKMIINILTGKTSFSGMKKLKFLTEDVLVVWLNGLKSNNMDSRANFEYIVSQNNHLQKKNTSVLPMEGSMLDQLVMLTDVNRR